MHFFFFKKKTILVKLPEQFQRELYHLIHFPDLIVEMLLMQEKTDLIQDLLTQIPDILVN